MLDALATCNPNFGLHEKYPGKDLGFYGNLSVVFDAKQRRGTITLEVFAAPETPREIQGRITSFIGYWTRVLPLSLTDLKLHVPISESLSDKPEVIAAIKAYNTQLESTLQEDIKLTSGIKLDKEDSQSVVDLHGGVCRDGNDFRSLLIRFFCETMIDCALRKNIVSDPLDWDLSEKGYNVQGIVHRRLYGDAGEMLNNYSRYGDSSIKQFVNHTGTLLLPFINSALQKTVNGLTSLNGIMDHLVNRGHKVAPFVEGLKVELLPFQLQSLQWALERESIEGGIQTLFNAKIPKDDDEGEVYYNPITGKLSMTAPRLVRGGIIAEQMGLGKTVISLALILKSPSPPEPQPCSSVLKIDPDPDRSGKVPFWDPDLYKRTSDTCEKRGSIISHGTLVVCKVSLVGQWIVEANSKLSGPGLIYQYHGRSRNRDPLILARNSIVVTTYETLSSDNAHHRTKSANSDEYCPPCEQIRWWRIICDESHLFRNQKTAAIMNLVADNKWLMSGTPICTELNDLKNQLHFIGIEDVPVILKCFNEGSIGVFKIAAKRDRFRDTRDRSVGPLSFLMRSIMIRHTQSQMYSGTNTTLMSLPPKSEIDMVVDWKEEEKHEYEVLEKQCRIFFDKVSRQVGTNFSRHYLKLQRGLTPLRVACAGGHIPLPEGDDSTNVLDEALGQALTEAHGKGDNGEGDDTRSSDHDKGDDIDQVVEEDMEETPGKKAKGKRKVQYSEFCYTSKMEKLIEQLLRIRDEDPTAKSLIFSQFNSNLKWLESKLPDHGFQCRTLSGSMTLSARAKALHDFQNDPPTTLFLLSLGAGAVGINLTAANRIFLLEPSFNPAVEAQAIGRVHRLGQKRPVEITRLIMKDSVESRMRQVLKDKFGELKADAMVGSIRTDKATIMKQEFDILYGTRTEEENGLDIVNLDAPEPALVGSATIPTLVDPSDDHDVDMDQKEEEG